MDVCSCLLKSNLELVSTRIRPLEEKEKKKKTDRSTPSPIKPLSIVTDDIDNILKATKCLKIVLVNYYYFFFIGDNI
jgi:hypothetical protein